MSTIKQSTIVSGIGALLLLAATGSANAERLAPKPAMNPATEVWCIVDAASLGIDDAPAKCQAASFWDPAPTG